MHFRMISISVAFIAFCLSSWADPAVKIVNFSANWCPLCRVLDPRLADAVDRFADHGVTLVEIEMTRLTRSDDDAQKALVAQLQALTAAHDAAYLWDWYGGHAGIAIIIAADNGEPLSCITTALSTSQIEDRLQESLVLATKVKPGHRRPHGTDCPPPMPNRTLAQPIP
jgi:thiol-disulfide isomerase/thioredoxin